MYRCILRVRPGLHLLHKELPKALDKRFLALQFCGAFTSALHNNWKQGLDVSKLN